MLRTRLSLLVVFLAAGATVAAARPSAAGRSSCRDLSGREISVPGSQPGKATALLFTSTECPCADRYSGRIAAFCREFAPAGVHGWVVFSGPGATAAAVDRFMRSRGIEAQAVLDPAGELSQRYGALVSPSAVLLDSSNRVRYRGRIDDNPEPVLVTRHDLREAVRSLLAGRPVALAETRAFGCSLAVQDTPKPPTPARVMPGMGKVSFPITAAGPGVQEMFNFALARWFGFNFHEAEAAFRTCVDRDPTCAMAQWGIALSLGWNYNLDFNPARLPEAWAAIRKAEELAGKASPLEQELIAALSQRYPAEAASTTKQDIEAYARAIDSVRENHPTNLNIAVLAAAAAMDRHPWDLWQRDGKPREGTERIYQLLEGVLKQDPNHIGAVHFYIHATEGSDRPQRALPYARKLADLAPQSGHLVHMPAHTFMRVGEYTGAVVNNYRAAAVDRAYFAARGTGTPYAGYYLHNLDFYIAACEMEGRRAEALEGARELALAGARYAPELKAVFCGTASSPLRVFARFGLWAEILKAPRPTGGNPFEAASWHYARTLALIGTRRLAAADAALKDLTKAASEAEAQVPEIPNPGLSDSLRAGFRVMPMMARGKLKLMRKDLAGAEVEFRQAAKVDDATPYIEPRVWRTPPRESLGSVQIRRGNFKGAIDTFQTELRVNPNSARALFGLSEAFSKAGKKREAAQASKRFRTAWARADVKLTLQDL